MWDPDRQRVVYAAPVCHARRRSPPGTGAGHLAIAMCHRFPLLRVVGIDPFEAALELAQGNVRAAALEDRIDLRPSRCRT